MQDVSTDLLCPFCQLVDECYSWLHEGDPVTAWLGKAWWEEGAMIVTHTNDNTGGLTAQPHLLQTSCWPGLTFTHSLTQAAKEHVVLWQSKRGTVLLQCWLQRQQVSYTHGSSTWDLPMPFPVLNLPVCTMLIKPMPGTSNTALQLNMQQGHCCHLWQHGDHTEWI